MNIYVTTRFLCVAFLFGVKSRWNNSDIRTMYKTHPQFWSSILRQKCVYFSRVDTVSAPGGFCWTGSMNRERRCLSTRALSLLNSKHWKKKYFVRGAKLLQNSFSREESANMVEKSLEYMDRLLCPSIKKSKSLLQKCDEAQKVADINLLPPENTTFLLVLQVFWAGFSLFVSAMFMWIVIFGGQRAGPWPLGSAKENCGLSQIRWLVNCICEHDLITWVSIILRRPESHLTAPYWWRRHS